MRKIFTRLNELEAQLPIHGLVKDMLRKMIERRLFPYHLFGLCSNKNENIALT
jgi:hypothetical protein